MEWMNRLTSLWARGKKQQLEKVNSSIRPGKPRIFGVTLKELMMRAPKNATVPLVVRRICEFIYKFGLDGIHLLRVHNNAKLVERLRLQFELMGDANLEEENDVTATAELLQVFLLGLPDTLIPRMLTYNFFMVLEDPQLNEEAVLNGLKSALNLLPQENYNVLKYISSLLAVLAENETDSKMSATSWAFLLGPIIFRCDLTSGMEGITDMDYSKVIMHLFTSKYNDLFLEKGDPTPQEFWEQCLKRGSSSLRFPPPKVQSLPSFTSQSGEGINLTLVSSASSSSLYQHPIPFSDKVDKIQAEFLQDLSSMDRKENMAEDKDKKNEDCSPCNNGEDRESSNPKFKAKPLCANENRTLPLQSSSLHTSVEHLSGQQSSPSSSLSGSSILDGSPCNGIKLFIPALDLSTLHEHVDGVDPIPMSQEQLDTHLWIKTNHFASPEDADVAILSPRSYKVKNRFDWDEVETTDVIEAPMSPSAYYDSGLFRAPLNIDVPPSPLIQQDLYKKDSYDDCNYRLRQLTMKIQDLKKKIKNFEESFERDHGYRPSQGEKSAQPDIKKYMNELSRARKNIKHLKEDTEKSNRYRHTSGISSSGLEMTPPTTHSVTVTLELILRCLKEQRLSAGRPEDIRLMLREQLQEEKLAIQRALLHFEGLHGRPTTSEEKDLMKPLYDRYRSVKRMLNKSLSPCVSVELQTVPENQMMEIPLSFSRDSMHVSATCLGPDDVATFGWELVTEDVPVFEELEIPGVQADSLLQADVDDKDDSSEDTSWDSHLHEMTLSELHVEIELSRGQKRRLRRALREFEMDFSNKNGRKALREDRYPFQTEYSAYKKVKARLRLLEALILKQCE